MNKISFLTLIFFSIFPIPVLLAQSLQGQYELCNKATNQMINRQLEVDNRACNCQEYEISSLVENNRTTFFFTNKSDINQKCNNFSVWVRIRSANSVKNTILETRAKINPGTTYRLSIPEQKFSVIAELGLRRGRYSANFARLGSNLIALPVETNSQYELECNIQAEASVACQGATTSVVFSTTPQEDPCEYSNFSVNSRDYCYPEGVERISPYYGPLSYSWSYDCLDDDGANVANGENQDLSTLQIDLSAPGLGKPVNCKVTLEVSDGERSSTCTAETEVSACILDCNGEINGAADFDACGVCGGNATTCGEQACDKTNITKSQIFLDGSARSMSIVVEKLADIFLRVSDNLKKASAIKEKATEARLEVWGDAWSLPSTVLSCQLANSLCTTVSLQSVMNDMNIFAEDLKQLGEDTSAAIIRKATKLKHKKRARELRRQLRKYYDNFQAEISALPGSHYVCAI